MVDVLELSHRLVKANRASIQGYKHESRQAQKSAKMTGRGLTAMDQARRNIT